MSATLHTTAMMLGERAVVFDPFLTGNPAASASVYGRRPHLRLPAR